MQRCTVFVLIFGVLGFTYMAVVGVFKSYLTVRSQIFLAAQVFKLLAWIYERKYQILSL